MIPLGDRCLVKPILPPEKTASGIYLPETARELAKEALVIEVGTDEELQKLVKKGDKILFGKYTLIESENPELFFIERAGILGILR